MDMGGHDMGGMDMGGDGGASCKISMLWNWYTVDSCFLSTSWHNRTKAQFAGTVIGIFLMVVAIEGVRRLGRDFDRRITAAHAAALARGNSSNVKSMDTKSSGSTTPEQTPSLVGGSAVGSGRSAGFLNLSYRPAPANFPAWPQQILRAAIYGTQFSAAFLVMLFGMYYNGYVLFAIFLGGFVGNALFSADTVGHVGELAKAESPCCC